MTIVEIMNEMQKADIHPDDAAQYYRQCSCCGAFVYVDEQSAERHIKGTTYYDICDHCIERAENNLPFHTFEQPDYPEYKDEEELGIDVA